MNPGANFFSLSKKDVNSLFSLCQNKTTHQTNTSLKLTIDTVAERKCKICITLAIKTQEHCSYVSIINFEQI